MKLIQLTERVWYYPHEKERDRPNLGYVRGDRWSLAVDAGHSAAHAEEFYRALGAEGLPLPELTVITHWHWDHAFGMHAAHGLCVANRLTDAYLREARERLAREGDGWALSLDEGVRREYAGGVPVVVVPADVTFSDEIELDLGGCAVRAFQAPSPHTDDSTLVHAVGEGVLFFGDAKSGTFPTWEKDPMLARALADAVEAVGAEVCVGGHWEPTGTRGLVEDLRRG